MSLFKKKGLGISIESIDENLIYSPVDGDIVPLEKVNDIVFSNKMLGDGIAVKPTSGEVYSPVNGIVTVLFPTKHAIGIEGDNGEIVIIHIGIDTVELNGKGFEALVKQGDNVYAGQLLILIDLELISSKYDPTTMIVIENSSDYTIRIPKGDKASAGKPLLQLTRV
ncbi:MAG: PTS glucose transporter subunit IIA [Erysipelotrichia bacterium]|nr:PTS glucose transporter subunit IIA [Erysipelotrichia bacterium]